MHQQTSQINQFLIYLPKPTVQLSKIFNQLKLFSKQRLDTNDQNPQGIQNQAEIKGLKFISTKLAKLFFKNRKLPYNQISKILIDNFASQKKDQRNIKRRVYDAINVLVAAGILLKKNNSIEMIKNKIKPKIQTDKKEKIEEEIAKKQDVIAQKMRHYQQLVNKHKLIKKMFSRNIKLTNEKEKSSNSNLKSSSHKSLSKRRSRNEFQIHSQEKNQCLSFNRNQQVVYEPHIFIIAKTENQQNQGLKVIRNFKNHESIDVFLPTQIKQKGHQLDIANTFGYVLKEQNILVEKDENYLKFECVKQQKIRMQDEQILQQEMIIQSEYRQQNTVPSKNVYSLIDILQLLLLDQSNNA